MTGHEPKRGIVRTLIDNSFLLVAGAVAALVWANMADRSGSTSYTDFVEFDVTTLWSDHAADPAHGEVTAGGDDGETLEVGLVPANELPLTDGLAGEEGSSQAGEATSDDEGHSGGGHHGLTIHFIVNDILMAFFFAIAAKEVWESLLPGGALANPRKAATPLLATVGGILGPALVYFGGAYLTGSQEDLGKGWAIPCATDIAFSYLIARFIFGAGHPAIAFLLLLAIADDAAGLMILAVFYPQAPLVPAWLLLAVVAMIGAYLMRRLRVQSHWAYLIGPGLLCWFSFYQAHIHAALGLVPIIPLLPHAHSDLGFYARKEQERTDTLNEFEHFWKTPVEFFLGLFGLANAGVVLSSFGTGTWLVLGGLLVGKPLGITAMTLLAEKGFKLEKPAGMDYRHVVTLGMVAGIGFTVALFVSVAAFPVPPNASGILDSVKMGALLSFAAAPLAIVLGRMLGIRSAKVADATRDEAPQAA